MIDYKQKGFLNAGKEILDEIQTQKKLGLTEAALIVEASAVSNARSQSGELRGSINHEVHEEFAVVGTNKPYAPYLEYGTGIYAEGGGGRKTPWVYYDENRKQWFFTRGMKPKPFLRPSLDENKKNIFNIFVKRLGKVR